MVPALFCFECVSLLIHAAPLLSGRVTERSSQLRQQCRETGGAGALLAPHTQCCDDGNLIFRGGLRCIANIDVRRDGGGCDRGVSGLRSFFRLPSGCGPFVALPDHFARMSVRVLPSGVALHRCRCLCVCHGFNFRGSALGCMRFAGTLIIRKPFAVACQGLA